jgi:polar amino acid transport system permease protein
MPDLAGYGPQLLEGAGVTLELAFGALVLGLVLGLAGASAKLSPNRWIRAPVSLALNLLRGIPEFLILLLIYFGATQDLELGPFAAGILALGLVFGAYASETFRGAFLAVPPGQIQAALAFGMTRTQVFSRVRLPQAWRFALPSLGNMWQGLLKDTSLVSVLGLEEILKKANIASEATKRPFTFYLAAMVIYLFFISVSNPFFGWLERRANRSLRR